MKVERLMRVAIIGGGPSALFVFKAILDSGGKNFDIDVFEARDQLGAGMPYSALGATVEHVTNVSGNEIPELPTPLVDWLKSLPEERLRRFDLDSSRLHEYKVVPRLLFGEYLSAQFQLLVAQATRADLCVSCRLNTKVTDVCDGSPGDAVTIEAHDGRRYEADFIVIRTGHVWPRSHEGRVAGYFDSPYPPQKLAGDFNHPIAVRGASLTAIDAVRTLAHRHGTFVREAPHRLSFRRKAGFDDFKIVMHSREGFLPGIRFHLDDPQLAKTSLLTEDHLRRHREENEGFVSLDYLFDADFKAGFREKDPAFFAAIEDMTLEEFVEMMMKERERSEPFEFFKQEYDEALRSIRNEESIYWKEKLAILSFAMNHPAKYFSAEDRLRLQRVLMPLISLVIAFVPQSSCEQLIALYDAGVLELRAVGSESDVESHADGGVVYRYGSSNGDADQARFATFVDCIGQRHLSFDDFPFAGLKSAGAISPAKLRFRAAKSAEAELAADDRHVERAPNGGYELRVPGIAVNDDFQLVAADGRANPRIFTMAVPLMGGFNPDYSGLDFCAAASERIVAKILASPTRSSSSD